MTGKEKNEALFNALLRVSVNEAFQKEMDALPSDMELAAYAPSQELDGRIKKLIDNNNKTLKMRLFVKRLGRAAACIAVLFTLSSILLLSVKATRNVIFNAIIEWHDQNTTVQFADSAADSNVYRPAYLPEGFKETSTEKFGNTFTIVFSNGNRDEILFDQRPADSGTISVDNEHTNYSKVDVSGNTAYCFEALDEDGSNVLIWQSGGIVFSLTSQTDCEELIRMGESLKNNF